MSETWSGQDLTQLWRLAIIIIIIIIIIMIMIMIIINKYHLVDSMF